MIDVPWMGRPSGCTRKSTARLSGFCASKLAARPPDEHLPEAKTPAAVNSISLISSIAMAVGLAASLPQILRMASTRSAGGQSVVGWAMGFLTNLSMGYVNFFGFHATALTISNLISGSLCVAAVLLIVRFNAEPVSDDLEQTTEIPLQRGPWPLHDHRPEAHHGHLLGMPTVEFAALREAVLSVEGTRQQRSVERESRELVAVAA